MFPTQLLYPFLLRAITNPTATNYTATTHTAHWEDMADSTK